MRNVFDQFGDVILTIAAGALLISAAIVLLTYVSI